MDTQPKSAFVWPVLFVAMVGTAYGQADLASEVARKIDQSFTLHKFAAAGSASAVRLLLSEPHIDLDLPDAQGWTPLMNAAQSGNPEVVRLMLKYPGSNSDIVNYRSTDGLTALTIAVIVHSPEISALLINAGANLDAVGEEAPPAVVAITACKKCISTGTLWAKAPTANAWHALAARGFPLKGKPVDDASYRAALLAYQKSNPQLRRTGLLDESTYVSLREGQAEHVGASDTSSIDEAPVVIAAQWAQVGKRNKEELEAAYKSAQSILPKIKAACPDTFALSQRPGPGPNQPVVLIASHQCAFVVSYWPKSSEVVHSSDSDEADEWLAYCTLSMATITKCTGTVSAAAR
ncbi:ankyrin repeat domain-containing protein [Caballeronia jiangsuensis]|uniref:Ankyrin repeat domain-containing protein n=1 Tax=Caballeronia jiangsuensis TaxID=1458357 RepID=A0ABW9CQL0_9BURK